ncbi:MAG: LAGLIDADG family homing endonuclease [Nanoarchaeota archaeon]
MKRTTDGRFIEERILLDKRSLKEILNSAKIKNNLTWKQLASKLEINLQAVIHDWLIPNRTIASSKFNKLIKLADVDITKLDIKRTEPFWGQKLQIKEVTFPDKENPHFAELYGVLLGDGCIFSDKKATSITGDKIVDYFYYNNFLNNLINNLFGFYPKIYTNKRERVIRCLIYSKKVAEYLNKCGFPIGVKYGSNPVIPGYIMANKEAVASCIRGLMDTDGSLSSHPNSKIMIHLSITIKSLIDSVSQGLKMLEIKHGVYNKGIMIYTKEKVKDFYDKIGFSNFKNNYKYKEFLRTGKVPKKEQVETFIISKIKS